MSRATPSAEAHAPQAVHALGALFVTAAVIASVLLISGLSDSPPFVDLPAAAVAPAAPATAAVLPDSGVPQASAVFGDQRTPQEEPAPTF